MKHPILYLCATAMSGLLATGASAQRVEKTLVAQAQMTTPGMGATGQSKRDQPSGAQQPREQSQGAQEKDANHKGANAKDAKQKQRDPGRDEPARAGSSPRQDDAGSDTRGAKGTPGSNTGSTGHGGMPGSGASSGSGGTADLRGQ